jgi:hypothetical protein
MGEYVSRIHDEVRGRPLYLVQETLGLEASDPPPRDGRAPERTVRVTDQDAGAPSVRRR